MYPVSPRRSCVQTKPLLRTGLLARAEAASTRSFRFFRSSNIADRIAPSFRSQPRDRFPVARLQIQPMHPPAVSVRPCLACGLKHPRLLPLAACSLFSRRFDYEFKRSGFRDLDRLSTALMKLQATEGGPAAEYSMSTPPRSRAVAVPCTASSSNGFFSDRPPVLCVRCPSLTSATVSKPYVTFFF